MEEEKLFYTLALQSVKGVGDVTAKRLLQRFGDAQSVLTASVSTLMKVEGMGDRLLSNLKSSTVFKEAELALARIVKHRIAVSYFEDQSYPQRLKHCEDGPVLLFSNQAQEWDNPRVISVVGTRNASRQGEAFCEQLIDELAVYNPVIVSGFAFGIDIAAHRAAWKNRLKTVAVLGHGLLEIYPRAHRKYQSIMEANGGFLTEFRAGSSMDKENFIRRNRIVAGLSEATIIVESALKGGSMSTARFANDYNREVLAVPGRVTDYYSQGCNELIKWQQAQLVTAATDVVNILQWNRPLKPKPPLQQQLFVHLSDAEQKIYDALLKSGKQSLDVLAISCQLPVYQVSSLLLGMELKGVVRPLPGKLFEAL
ncbi:DNA-processing protein DprA [Flavobacterium sp. JP2137]|uniref:DNA-processing protein DprA n=1 Tax=Flavobacterium sp. JP2137 TaxID=3414510 RepID=UPI003D2FC64B